MGSFIEQLDAEELLQIDGTFRKFVRPGTADSYERSWGHFAYGYQAAFEILLDEALRWWPRRLYLVAPTAMMCRHALELSLKEAADDVARHLGTDAKLIGHSLDGRWKELARLLSDAGYPVDDPWSQHCA